MKASASKETSYQDIERWLNLELACRTDPGWAQHVIDHFEDFLIDHADCERKASALAMSLVARFADKQAMVEPMICLAKEELQHFHEVYRYIQAQGLKLRPSEKDPYVAVLNKMVRHNESEYFLDRLLVSCVIEARGCERFRLLSETMEQQKSPHASFYRRLAREEAGHHMIFLRIARHYYDFEVIDRRLKEILGAEGGALRDLPMRAAVH